MNWSEVFLAVIAVATLIMAVSITLSALAQFWILRQTRKQPGGVAGGARP